MLILSVGSGFSGSTVSASAPSGRAGVGTTTSASSGGTFSDMSDPGEYPPDFSAFSFHSSIIVCFFTFFSGLIHPPMTAIIKNAASPPAKRFRNPGFR